MATETLVSRLDEAAFKPHDYEFAQLGVLLAEAAARVRFLESVAGPVSASTTHAKARAEADAQKANRAADLHEPLTHE